MESRYVPKPCLRSFDRDFETLVADSLRFRRFVNRALQTHFWHISFGLWCSCQPPIDLPYLDREISLPLSPLSSDSALSFVREMAVSRRVPLRRLVETNGSTAHILSFKRYAIDFNRSEYVYEQVIESKCDKLCFLLFRLIRKENPFGVLIYRSCSHVLELCEPMSNSVLSN